MLSDDDERAFYDRHRDELLHSNDDDDFDPTHLKPHTSRSSLNPGLTTKQLLKFFDSTLWKGDFSDSETSFFTIYRNLFNQLSADEKIARKDTTIVYPSFGTSESSYDQDLDGARALRHFYSVWGNFATQKTFDWIEPHRTNHQVDRRVKRLIEKENQRSREAARREYNETIRSLVSFIKKRDPRFASSTACNPEKWRAQEIQRIKRELREVAERRAKERENEAQQYREQAWQRLQSDKSRESESDLEHENSNVEDNSEDEEPEPAISDWYCAACSKEFNSQGAWDNHERSKKHRQNAQRLRKQMLKEDADLAISTPISTALPSTVGSPKVTPSVQDPGGPVKEQIDPKFDPQDIGKLDLQDFNDKPIDCKNDFAVLKDADVQSIDSDGFRQSNRPNSPEAPEHPESEKNSGKNVHVPLNDDFIEAPGIVRKKGKKSKGIKSMPVVGDADSINDIDEAVQPAEHIAQPDSSPKPPEISKRDKRRAREAAKKLLQNGLAQPAQHFDCNVCGEKFESKNKMFDHVKRFNHASAINLSAITSSSKKSSASATNRSKEDKPSHLPTQKADDEVGKRKKKRWACVNLEP